LIASNAIHHLHFILNCIRLIKTSHGGIDLAGEMQNARSSGPIERENQQWVINTQAGKHEYQ
jgi:hypothetical protein